MSADTADDGAGVAGDARDDGVVDEIVGLLTAPKPRSFFLFAGAGSGKTHTLKEVLVRLTGRVDAHPNGQAFAANLRREGRQLAVVTYTNNASDEIERRLASNPLVTVSTIHTFCWRLIEGFDDDIRAGLLVGVNTSITKKEAEEPGEMTDSGKRRNKDVLDRMKRKWAHELEGLRADRGSLAEIDHFTYSPDQKRFGAGALTHAQVIAAAVWLLQNRRTLRRILVDQHPIVFIDESQDTSKSVLHSLLALERETELRLGLIGDHRQRIYMEGEQTLPQVIPDAWARPALRLNRRCPHRVVRLLNAVWLAKIDGRTETPAGGEQHALSTRPVGAVRLYMGSTNEEDKPAAERRCALHMAVETGDPSWSDHAGGYKLLVLEHQLAAERNGFGELYRHLHRYDENRAKTNEIGVFSVFRDVMLPLFEAAGADGHVDAWNVQDLLARHAAELDVTNLSKLDAGAQRSAFARVGESARRLLALWAAGDPDLASLLRATHETGLLGLEPQLLEALATQPAVGMPTSSTTRAELLAGALLQPWSAYRRYHQYAEGLQSTGTHQGVKGSEFERVLVVCDDDAAGGNLFAYEKLLGAKPPSDSDQTNEQAGKETSIDRTLRLFYVTCSRARESLAVVIWTTNPTDVAARMTGLGWFAAGEIHQIPTAP